MNTTDEKNPRLETLTLQNTALQENILMVDDHPENLRLLYQLLSKRGYKVLANTGWQIGSQICSIDSTGFDFAGHHDARYGWLSSLRTTKSLSAN